RTLYISSIRTNGGGNFFGPLISHEPTTVSLTVQHRDPGSPGPAWLEARVQGLTAIPQPAPDHHVTVQLNSAVVGQIVFSGQGAGVLRVAVPSSLLSGGENTVTLTSGGETDMSLVDTIRLTYWHTYTADSDGLRFTAPAGRAVTLAGFSSA